MKKLVAYLTIIISVFCASVTANASTIPETIKIGLFFGSSALSTAQIECDGDIVVYYDGQEVLRHGALTIQADENNLLQITSGGEHLYTCDDKELKFAATAGLIQINGTPYRGSLQIINLKNGKMTVINKVGLEEYLYGVVPLEMSTGFPIEALKCQAICARTYAVTSMGRFASQGFDLTNTTLSQVYGGASVEQEDCTRAVDETRGKLVMYQGQPAQTFYSATSSGHTLNVKDVWGSELPYLVGVDDSLQEKVKPGNDPWTVTYTKEELKQKLVANGVDIGDIVDMEIIEQSPEGAVTKLKFTGTNGEKIYERESTRTLLNLRSQCYTIEKPGSSSLMVMSSDQTVQCGSVTVLGAEGTAQASGLSILSADGVSDFQAQPAGDTYILHGSGYGHGLGMSQNGAKAMALEGYSCEEILTHYFTGTEIQ